MSFGAASKHAGVHGQKPFKHLLSLRNHQKISELPEKFRRVISKGFRDFYFDMRQRQRILTAIMMFVSCATQAQGPVLHSYVVKDGESLSQIADRIRGGHTYGAGQNLERLLKVNPFIADQNQILTGVEIRIPEWGTDLTAAMANVTNVVVEKRIPAQTEEPTSEVVTHEKVVIQEIVSKDVVIAESAVGKKPVVVENTVIAQKPAPIVIPQTQPDPSRRLPSLLVKEQEEEINHRAEFFGGYQFSSINATDKTSASKADLNSSQDFTAGMRWLQLWSDSFSTSFDFSARSIGIVPLTSSSKTLSNTNQTLMALQFSLNKNIFANSRLGFNFGYSHELFLHGVSATEVSLDIAGVPKAEITFKQALLKKGKTQLEFGWGYSYLGPSSTDTYTIESGQAYSAAMGLRHSKLKAELGYKQRTQNTSFMDVGESNVFGILTYSIDLFKEEER
ncbi:type IV pilus assembly protein FimV [Bdellovibrio reynosensis]|uniref:LysM peptidoglycan-binding domain-containing protein n=1 Tax=Bdellovibrio reynosensis TaxID=2835041 RepID=A0ABY4C511_9BACT|nr:LysM domain-containing protein [Bdellovibrio reynosensis]UOE99942.1 LysM peptidoglycan-binding domain-containing protein [Bdellovibrio reynosensis]